MQRAAGKSDFITSPLALSLSSSSLDHPSTPSTMLRTLAARTIPRAARPATSTPRVLAAPFAHFSSTAAPPDSDKTHPALVKDPPVANPSADTDPWTIKVPPMPEPPQLDPSIRTMDDLIASPHPEGRDNEPTETLRKRLVYESRKRGILEMDLILSTFAKDRLAVMSDRELREYDRVRPRLSLLRPHCPPCARADPARRAPLAVPHPPRLDHLLLRDGQGRGARTLALVRGPRRAPPPLGQQGQDRAQDARPRGRVAERTARL